MADNNKYAIEESEDNAAVHSPLLGNVHYLLFSWWRNCENKCSLQVFLLLYFHNDECVKNFSFSKFSYDGAVGANKMYITGKQNMYYGTHIMLLANSSKGKILQIDQQRKFTLMVL